MKFALLMYETPGAVAERFNEATRDAYWATWIAYGKSLEGVMVGGAGLQDIGTATTVRLRDGERHVEDGPFAETKEILGGFYLIDVPSLDEALAHAARSPAVGKGSVEVRPLLQM